MGNCNSKSNKLLKFKRSQTDLIPGLSNDLALDCLIRVPFSSHPALRLVSQGWNAAVSDPSFYSDRLRLGSAERLVCLIQPAAAAAIGGGPPLYNLNVYNITRHEWRRLTVPVLPFSQCVAVPAAGKVVILGGWDPSTLEPANRVLVVDLRTGTWKNGSPMPTARSFFAAASVGSAAVYIAGGHDGQKNALRSAEEYDVTADEWRPLSLMSEERDESQGFSFDSSRFWVVSGYGTESQGRFRPDAEVFDPKTNSWTKIDGVWPYPSRTLKSTTAAAAGGGPQRWLLIEEGEVREFKWEEKRWEVLKSDSVPKVSRSSSISVVHTGDGNILVMGNGQDSGGEGALMAIEEGRKNEGVIKWKLVQVHCTFKGFPFSAAHLIV